MPDVDTNRLRQIVELQDLVSDLHGLADALEAIQHEAVTPPEPKVLGYTVFDSLAVTLHSYLFPTPEGAATALKVWAPETGRVVALVEVPGE